MASPSNIGGSEREAFRNAQLERIVQVIRFTKGASRKLELPYMNLPHIADQSVRIWTHAEEHHFVAAVVMNEESDDNNNNNDDSEGSGGVEQSISAQFGTVSKGDDTTWEELQLLATAELNAVVDRSKNPRQLLDEGVTAALSKIQDPHHRQVIAQLDKEKAANNRSNRRNGNGNGNNIQPIPTVRARGEPLVCEFVMKNPMAVEIHVTELQLVARMVEAKDGSSCTNQDAIRIKTIQDAAIDNRTWTFASTEHLEFSVAEFCRTAEANQKSCKSANEKPFFVVAKRTYELAAGGDILVSAGLCPLVEGDLEILGVRCKLFDKVWVYHPFDIPGPLLNNNRTNQANRVRGESMVLKSKIEVEMPCLTAELVKRIANESSSSSPSSITTEDDGGPLLEGQISSWTIRLRNVGNAPASTATLKTNFPWVNIVSTSSSDRLSVEQLEAQATSRCLGPTGTLITLPIQRDSLKQQGAIQPGESVDIPIQIHMSGNGKHEFYMLYRYELWDPSGKSTRHRWLRPWVAGIARSSRGRL
jgi:hypothetical protein